MWQLTIEHVQIETVSQQEITAEALDPVSTIAGSLGGSIGTISQVFFCETYFVLYKTVHNY